MTRRALENAREAQSLACCIGLLVSVSAVGCGDTVTDGAYTCTAPGRDTDCPTNWYCRTDPGHPDELRCHERAGPPPPPGEIGSVCDRVEECLSTHCSNGHCAPSGFAWIEPGDFFMGSPVYEPRRNGDEELHQVSITRPFLIGTTEVTQAEWRAVFQSDPSYFDECGDDCPVERVNLFEALEYANALSTAEGLDVCYTIAECDGDIGSGCPDDTDNMGRSCSETDFDDGLYRCTNVTFAGLDCSGYRLPTEAEWEYAARAGSTSSYPGVVVPAAEDCDDDLDAIGWYACNADNRTHPVGQLEPNAWGLYDTLGNVFEEVWDEYAAFDSLAAAAVDPRGPRETTAATNGVYRGCAYDNPRGDCRSAFRGHSGTQGRSSVSGFRLARSIVGKRDGS